MDRYELIRSAQQTVGQPRQSVIMPINDAPVAPKAPPQTPGTPFRNGEVPRPLSWPETLPARTAPTPLGVVPPPAEPASAPPATR
jgi:hypothetical protein